MLLKRAQYYSVVLSYGLPLLLLLTCHCLDAKLSSTAVDATFSPGRSRNAIVLPTIAEGVNFLHDVCQ